MSNTSLNTTYVDSALDDVNASLRFRMRTGGIPVNVMAILGSGNIAIGMLDPGAFKLNVTGNTAVTGNTTVTGNTAVTGNTTVTGVIKAAGGVNLKAVVALADVAATLTATQLADSGIFTITPTVARILTTDTAANIVAALPGYQVGTWFDIVIVNTAAFDVTLAAGTGVTLVGKMIANNVSVTFKARIDSATAVTVYRM